MTLRERLDDYMTTVRPTADFELTPNGPALTNSGSRLTGLRLGFFTEVPGPPYSKIHNYWRVAIFFRTAGN